MIDGKYSPIIRTDSQRIMQVLLGLQSNALKFTQEGHVKIIVRMIEGNIINPQQKIEICIEDTGIGISKKNQDKLFKLFGFIQDSN